MYGWNFLRMLPRKKGLPPGLQYDKALECHLVQYFVVNVGLYKTNLLSAKNVAGSLSATKTLYLQICN